MACAEQVALTIGIHVGLDQRRRLRLEQALQGWQHLLRQRELHSDRSIWVTLNSPWVSLVRTRLPGSILRMPTRPVTGERICV